MGGTPWNVTKPQLGSENNLLKKKIPDLQQKGWKIPEQDPSFQQARQKSHSSDTFLEYHLHSVWNLQRILKFLSSLTS